ncbi:hypothetical protein X801_03631 [Opisthorchis viverrini]|uniref:Uncharacterized protein n=1 Tax=Opisthorchis viverrini TaxID=6198 RepID=A0A1S8X1D0_OPIVI|nr:hypothetical protein X801_03631 [Opisthorchis viverrini]
MWAMLNELVSKVARAIQGRSVDGTEDSRSQGQVKIILEGLLGHIMTALPNDQCARIMNRHVAIRKLEKESCTGDYLAASQGSLTHTLKSVVNSLLTCR